MKIAVIGKTSYLAQNFIRVVSGAHPETEWRLYGREDVFDDADCDLILLFAGKTGAAAGFDAFDDFIDANERLLLSVLNKMREQKSRAKLVYPGSRLVYRGRPGALKEDAEKAFHTPYAVTKYAAEQYLAMYHRAFDLRYVVFRVCVPYGTLVPGASSYGTAEFMLRLAAEGKDITLYGDGSVRRTLTYIEDLCDILYAGGVSDACENDVYNIGGEDYSLREMAEKIASRYGVGVQYAPYPALEEKIESGDTVFDDTKLRGVMDVRYRTRFADWVMRQRP